MEHNNPTDVRCNMIFVFLLEFAQICGFWTFFAPAQPPTCSKGLKTPPDEEPIPQIQTVKTEKVHLPFYMPVQHSVKGIVCLDQLGSNKQFNLEISFK